MARNTERRRTGRFRVGWFLSIVIVLAAAAAGGYMLYKYQHERNTQRLLIEAKAAKEAGDFDKAIQTYRIYLGRKDSDIEALHVYADLLYDGVSSAPELIGDAIRALRQLRHVEPSNTQVLERLGNLYSGIGEFGLAEEIGKSWTALAPSSPEAVLALAQALHGLHREDEAIELLAQASERAPQEPRFYPPLIGLTSESSEHPDAAIRWTDRALEHASDAYQVRMAAFNFCRSRKDPATAEQHLKKALELAPDDLEVLLAAVQFFTSADRIDEAESLVLRAIDLAPGDRRLLLARMSLAVRKYERDEMIALADEAMKAASSSDYGLIAQAAELYLRSQALPQADAAIRRIADDPKLSDKMTASLDTLRGGLALAANEPHAAIPHLQEALRRQPTGLWTIELLARSYLRTGALEEAADLYRRLILLAPDARAPRLALARIELRGGWIAKALEQLRTISPAGGPDAQQVKLIRIAASLQQMIADGKKPSECGECRSALERISADHPADFESVELLSQCLVAVDLPGLAVEAVRGWSGDADASRSLWGDLGRRLVAEGRGDLAAAWAKELLERFPGASEGHLLRVRMLLAEGRGNEAERYIEQCTLGAEQKGVLWAAIADASSDNAQSGANPPDKAAGALRRAAEMMPRDIDVRRKLARLLTDVNEAEKVVEEIRGLEGSGGALWKYERASLLLRLKPGAQPASEAVGLLRECLTARPAWVEARTLLGLAQETTGALAEAAESYRTAIAQRPESAGGAVAIRLVEVLKRQGRYREADDALAPLSKALPDSPTVLRLVADRHLRARDVLSAAATAERLLQLNPDDPAWAATTADLQLRAGQADKAEQIARSSLERHPDSVSLLTSLSRALFALGRADDAEAATRRSAAEQNSAPFDLLLARVLVERGESDEARKIIEAALVREPKNAALHAAASDFWGAQGDRPRQLQLARRAVELRGDDPGRSLALASLLASGPSASEHEEAEAIIRRRLTEEPMDVQTLLLDAQVALTANPSDVHRAETDLARALETDSRSLSAYKMLAAVQLQSGRLNVALDTAGAGLTLAPDDVDLLMLSAEIQQQRGEYDRCLSSLRRVLAIAPRLPRALVLFADASRQAKQVDPAIEFIERLSPEPKRPAAETLLLAKLYESKGDQVRADALFGRALNDDPGAPGPAMLTEYILFQARCGAFDQVYSLASQHRLEHPGDVETLAVAAELLGSQSPDPDLRLRGLEWLDEIAANYPDYAADARYRSGMCRLQHGDLVEAETMLLRASQLAPDNPKPVNALAWLYGEESGKPQQGLSVIEKFLAVGGRATPEMLDTRGTLLLRLKRLNEAREVLSSCLATVEQSPTRAAATYHLGLVMLESGANQDGLSNVRLALDLHERFGGLALKEVQEARRLLAQANSDRR